MLLAGKLYGMAKYWLMKSEPSVFSIDDLARDEKTHWDGVRNYQARNFMQSMALKDKVLFYHYNADETGVAGIAEVCREAYPDFSAWDPSDSHFDPKTKKDAPTWMMVDIKFVEKFPRIVTLHEMKDSPELEGMTVIQKGSRLSVQSVSEEHFKAVVKMAKG